MFGKARRIKNDLIKSQDKQIKLLEFDLAATKLNLEEAKCLLKGMVDDDVSAADMERQIHEIRNPLLH